MNASIINIEDVHKLIEDVAALGNEIDAVLKGKNMFVIGLALVTVTQTLESIQPISMQGFADALKQIAEKTGSKIQVSDKLDPVGGIN